MVDVATGWSERVAVMGRGQRAMEAGFEHLISRLPFAIVELHPDNGSEFFNAHLVRYWKEKVVGVQLSRSRPYQKNDNRLVEQKNDTLVRQYFGDLRFDRPEQIEAMNALYEQMWLYYNLFQPVMHLIEKILSETKCVASGTKRARPLSGSKPPASSVPSKSSACKRSMSRPTRSTCVKRSTKAWHSCGAKAWPQPRKWLNQQKGDGRAENGTEARGQPGPAREPGLAAPSLLGNIFI